MKNVIFKKALPFTFFLFLGFLLNQSSGATGYSPKALTAVIKKAKASTARGHHPVALFDLDDTLITTRDRTLRILFDFVKQTAVQARFPRETAQVRMLTVPMIHYSLNDTLKGVGITQPEFVSAANDFWNRTFFTNEYSAGDIATEGAATYLSELVKAGSKIVYLTGRDSPRMHDGTLISLKRNHFPTSDRNTLLLMKPNAAMDDLEFKKQSFAQVASLGEVVGAFENEPANINAMAAYFQGSIPIFLDTIHSPKPDVPGSGVFWVLNFYRNEINF